MSGKTLAMAMVGAAIVGGAAGIAGSTLTAAKPEAPGVDPTIELNVRLKATELDLGRTRQALENAVASLRELEARVGVAEAKAAEAAAAQNVLASAPAKPFRERLRRGAPGVHTAGQPGVEVEAPVFFGGELGDAITVNLGDALAGLDGQAGDMGGELAAFRAGLALRKLPEDERWQKAAQELGLSSAQVEDLRKATAAREAAMKEALTTETRTGPNGGVLTIQKTDPAKAAHAEADYHDRVNSTLDANQKKDWSAKGYDRAFGRDPFGGGGAVRSVVMAMDVNTSGGGDEEAPPAGAK